MKDKKTVSYLLKIGVPIIIIGGYYLAHSSMSSDMSMVGDAITDRFSETESDFSSFDRLIESKEYFNKEANLFDIIMGKGFFSEHHFLGSPHEFLHVGWTNLIFKGGLLLFIVVLFSDIKAFTILRNPNRYTRETIFAAMFCVNYFFTFFFGNAMGFGPNLFFLFYSLVLVNRPVRNL